MSKPTITNSDRIKPRQRVATRAANYMLQAAGFDANGAYTGSRVNWRRKKTTRAQAIHEREERQAVKRANKAERKVQMAKAAARAAAKKG